MKMFKNSKGFTLIELLVVIAILGVLSAAVLIAINPLQKINQANDATVKGGIDQIATAMQTYYTSHQYYPSALSDLQTSGELSAVPTGPAGVAYVLTTIPAACTTAAKTCTSVSVTGILKAGTLASPSIWCFRSTQGSTIEVANQAACPAS